ncbi:SPOR domain-containing protein [Algibacter mikhailovii]|uniref:SPOR domain-containing protein n=1 Tax=Algibacter mikhailovii TaxID=425498 RepID=A0A918QXE0_9FLAO|nr:SPOR domain-containing protein [Algibacter mikhailovii]GGZ74274.1 hypothetical protein GCM10007028_09480 [Algibacter mikhailovii]
MTSTSFQPALFVVLCFALATTYGFAQQGHISINQDHKISTLLETKKEMNKNEYDPDRYKIQIYSGGRSEALESKKEFTEIFADKEASIQYETPNFKIWTGNFRTRLEADRALKIIKKEFPTAFIFKPKKEKL